MYALALIVSMTLCYSFAFIYSEYQFKNGLIIYSLFGSITLLVYQSFAHVGDSGRLEGVLNSNSIGLISLSIILAAQLSNRIYMVLLLSLPSTYVLYLTNSRSAIVGLVIGLGVYYLPRIKMINYIVALILLLIIFLTVSYEQIGDVFSYNINKILALDDPYRGIGSGATNRAFAWAETWDLFVQHPFTGVGFRAHEDLLTTESSSHNGYLSILAEVGIIGSFATAYLIIHSIYRYCKSYRRDILSRFWLALIMSYLFVAVFERFLFNTGNPTSLLFQLALVNSFICQNRNLDAVI
jgi:O-antigen ligase